MRASQSGGSYGAGVSKTGKLKIVNPKAKAKPAKHPKPKAKPKPLDPAQVAVNRAYKPAETQLNQTATNIAPWFQQYQDTVRGGMQAAQQYNAPILANARTAAQNTGKPVLQNVDPNSDAAHNDVLAAAARSAIGNQFANLLGAQAQAGQTYLAGRQDVGNLYQQQARENLTQQRLDLTGKKAQAVQDYKDAAHKNALEDAAFGLNVQKAKSSESLAKRRIRVQTRSQRQAARDRAGEVNQYGYSNADWKKMTPAQRQQIMAKVKKQGRAGTAGGAKDPYGNTPKQQRAANSNFKKASTIARQIVKPGDHAKNIYELLVVKYPTGDSDTLKAVAILSTGGALSSKLKKSLISQGINPALLKARVKAQKIDRPPNAPGAYGQARPT